MFFCICSSKLVKSSLCLTSLASMRLAVTLCSRSYKTKVLTRPRPIVSLNNWIYGNLVRGYFQQDFFLDEFCKSCPIIVERILECLGAGKTKSLTEAVEASCLQGISETWNQSSVSQQKLLSSLTREDFKYHYPTIRMRLPGPVDPTKQLTAYLNIHLQVYFFAKVQDIVTNNLPDFMQSSDIELPLFYRFEFEREITRDVDSSWRLEHCGTFPSLIFKPN